jgi:hypothetical protein
MKEQPQMIAYHGKAALKANVLTMISEHERLDSLVKGTYSGQRGKKFIGCAVGCTLESIRRIEGAKTIEHSNHTLYERYLGVPMILARIEDALFEALPDEDAKTWPRRFTDAIPVGADLSMVWPRWMRRVLGDPAGAVQQRVEKYPAIGPSIAAVVALFDHWIATGEKPTISDWQQARSEARATADAAYAADAAAYAAYAAYATAAYAVYAAYAADADAQPHERRRRRRRRQADWLIEELQQAPVSA